MCCRQQGRTLGVGIEQVSKIDYCWESWMKFIGRHSVRFITLLRISFWQTRMAMKNLSHLPFKACGTPLADAGITWQEGKNRGLFAGGTSSQCQSRLGDMRSRNKLNVTHHSANTRTSEEFYIPCQVQVVERLKIKLNRYKNAIHSQWKDNECIKKINELTVVYIVFFFFFLHGLWSLHWVSGLLWISYDLY